MKLMAEGHARHGEVFTVPVLHKNITFLLGPRVSAHFFKANDEEMSQKEVRGLLAAPLRGSLRACCVRSGVGWLTGLHRAQVYEFNVPTFGKGVVFDVDHKVGRPRFSTRACMQAQQTHEACCERASLQWSG